MAPFEKSNPLKDDAIEFSMVITNLQSINHQTNFPHRVDAIEKRWIDEVLTNSFVDCSCTACTWRGNSVFMRNSRAIATVEYNSPSSGWKVGEHDVS